jgi:hypothetical protein
VESESKLSQPSDGSDMLLSPATQPKLPRLLAISFFCKEFDMRAKGFSAFRRNPKRYLALVFY